MGKEHTIRIGSDGQPMSVWQVWLRRLCAFILVWAVLEAALGILLVVGASLFTEGMLENLVWFQEIDVPLAGSFLGASTLVGAAVNGAVGLLGINGAKNPSRIALFFWIVLIDAVLTAWALASNASLGILDPGGTVSGLFIITLAVCAWQVRKQTGYFDAYP